MPERVYVVVRPGAGGGGKPTRIHYDEDCRAISQSRKISEKDRTTVAGSKPVCRYCRGIDKPTGPPQGTNPRDTRNRLLELGGDI